MNFIKKLFHSHIWKTEKIEFLYSKKHMYSLGPSIEVDYYDVYAHHQFCILCNKARVLTKGDLVPFPPSQIPI